MATADLPAYKRAPRTVPCPYCAAEVGEPCRDRSGRANTTHSGRQRLTWRAQSIGYEEGLADALMLLDWQVRKHGANATIEQVREPIADQHAMVMRSNLRDEES